MNELVQYGIQSCSYLIPRNARITTQEFAALIRRSLDNARAEAIAKALESVWAIIESRWDGVRLEVQNEKNSEEIAKRNQQLQVVVGTTSEIPKESPIESILVDGVARPTQNSEGQRIASDLPGIEAFWRWYGASSCVDAHGRPLVMYHGTDAQFDEFDAARQGQTTDAGWFGNGFYFAADRSLAEQFASEQGRVVKAYVRMDRAYDWRAHEGRGLFQNDQTASLEKQRALRAQGFDGVVVYEEFVHLRDGEHLNTRQWELLLQTSELVGMLGKDKIETSLKQRQFTAKEFIDAYGADVFREMPKVRVLREVVAYAPNAIRVIEQSGPGTRLDGRELFGWVVGEAKDRSLLEGLGIEVASEEPSADGAGLTHFTVKASGQALDALDPYWGTFIWSLHELPEKVQKHERMIGELSCKGLNRDEISAFSAYLRFQKDSLSSQQRSATLSAETQAWIAKLDLQLERNRLALGQLDARPPAPVPAAEACPAPSL